MSTNTATPPTSSKLPFSRILAAGGIAIVGSVIANLVVYFIGRMLVQPPADFLPLASPIPTILFTTLFLVVGTAVFAMINAWSSNRARVFTIVAVIALVLGFIPDIMLIVSPESSTMGTPTFGAVMVLIVMHFVAFAITMWSFLTWAPRR